MENITEAIFLLLEGMMDKSDKVRKSSYIALRQLASTNYLNEVIHAGITFRHKKPKLCVTDLRYLLDLIRGICDDAYLEKFSYHFTEKLIDFCMEEAQKSICEFQACDILSVLAKKNCDRIVDEVLVRLKTANEPHVSLIYCIGNISVVNTSDFTPRAKEVLELIMNHIDNVKADNMRRIYASAIGQLAESVNEYHAMKKCPESKEEFSPIVHEIFDLFTGHWLLSKDSKTCEAVTQSLSPLILLFSVEKLKNEVPQILNTLLGLYRKSPALPRYSITQCMSNLLVVADKAAIQPVLDMLLHSLHIMVWVTPDYAQPLTIKNHSEALRCYSHLANLFGEKMCEVIIRHLKSSSEQDRVVALIVTTHLMANCEQVLKDRIQEIISTLRAMLHESSIRIKKAAVNLIVSLAYRQYFGEKDAVFIEFLLKHTNHLQTAQNKELAELESICSKTLHTLSTSVTVSQPLCWKVMLKMLADGERGPSAHVIGHSLAHIIEQCDKNVLKDANLEQNERIVARVLSLLGNPLNVKSDLTKFFLDFVPFVAPVDADIWRKETSQHFPTFFKNEWDENEWENAMLRVWQAALLVENGKEWIRTLASHLASILAIDVRITCGYDEEAAILERSMVYVMLAGLSPYLEEEAINDNIDMVLNIVRKRQVTELKSCGRFLSILSRTHALLVLNHMEELTRCEMNRKTTKFLGILKDSKNEADVEVGRSMICTCYGESIPFMLPTLFLPKSKSVRSWIMGQIYASKELQTRRLLLKTLAKVAEITSVNSNLCPDLEECRKQLLFLANALIEGNKTVPDAAAVDILISALKFRPSLRPEEKASVLKKCLIRTFEFAHLEPESISLQLQLSSLIAEVIDGGSNMQCMEDLVTFLKTWMADGKVNNRKMALELLLTVLQCTSASQEVYSRLNQMGSLLAAVSVRACEKDPELKHLAFECVLCLLPMAECKLDESIVENYKDKFQLAPNEADISEFWKIVCFRFPTSQMPPMVAALIHSLSDVDSTCGEGAGRILISIFGEMGPELQHQALDVFSNLLEKSWKLPTDSALQVCSVKAILSLAQHHKKMFLNTMLSQSLPLPSSVCKCWQSLPENEAFANDILDNLLETIKTNSLYEECRPGRVTAAILPLSATFAMKEIMNSCHAEGIVGRNFADLFSTFLILLISYVGVPPPPTSSFDKICSILNKDALCKIVPAKIAFEALAASAMCVRYECLARFLQSNCTVIDSNQCINEPMLDFISSLTRELCKAEIESGANTHQYIVKIFDNLRRYIGSNIEAQRIAVASFYTEILSIACDEEVTLVDTVISSLMTFLNDSSGAVRQSALKGFASVCNLPPKMMNKHCESALTALVHGLDDDDVAIHTGIALESLKGLSKLLPYLKENGGDDRYAMSYVSVAMRIKPFFEKEDGNLRGNALKLFGELAKQVNEDESAAFEEQVVNNFLSLVFHSGERETSVMEVSKNALVELEPFLKMEKVTSLIDDYATNVISHEEFISQMAQTVAELFPNWMLKFTDVAVSYCKSRFGEIRASAALFLGYSYRNSGLMNRSPAVISILLKLMKDEDVEVRANAATALALSYGTSSVP